MAFQRYIIRVSLQFERGPPLLIRSACLNCNQGRGYGIKAQHRLTLTDEVKKVRNVGVMAHIDAGKTTTTERMLFYAGMIEYPGEVHHGDTVTDFLPQERERGITIQSAVVSFPWKEDYRINLIDTPGHVDFTYEVERSVRAVDSAVAILDASAGVEAQTLTVWRQATENKLPRLIYLNKMDKNTASVQMCLDSIKMKLKAEPVLLQLPVFSEAAVVGKGSGIVGVVDLVKMIKITFEPESKGRSTKIQNETDENFLEERNRLVEQVADFDPLLAETIIETESVSCVTSQQLEEAIKRATLTGQVVPVLLGSSYKNVGVQLLLDAIIKYLPYPEEIAHREEVVSAYGSELCSFAFKTLHDKQLGPLTFMRVFSGTITAGDKIFNVSRNKQEKVLKVYQPLANDLKEVSSVGPGQVTIISGLKDTVTGDTITSSSSASASAKKKLSKKNKNTNVLPVIPGVSVPDPVFFCSIEPASLVHQKLLDEALVVLQREDPSLKVRTDPETGQTILSGMGELHIEIVHDRLKKEFKVDADLGKLSVAYKETLLEPVKKLIHFERRLNDQTHRVDLELSLLPTDKADGQIRHAPGKESQENLAQLTERHERCIQNGVESALRFGPKLGFPIIDVEVLLHWCEIAKFTSESMVAAAAATCVREMMQESIVVLREPMVDLTVIVDERSQSGVIDDLNRRRFMLKYIDFHQGNKIIAGEAPLAELMGYSTALRSISSGYGTYSMQLSYYRKVLNRFDEEKIITSVRGFY